jgi:hypothetical protein
MRKFGSRTSIVGGETFGGAHDDRPEGMLVAAVLVSSLVGALAYLLL